MYATKTRDIPIGRHYRVLVDGAPMSFRQFFEQLASDQEFPVWFCCTLAHFEGAAFYWELPALTSATLDDDAEFVLIEAPLLEGMPMERAPFAQYFEEARSEDEIVFPNLDPRMRVSAD